MRFCDGRLNARLYSHSNVAHNKHVTHIQRASLASLATKATLLLLLGLSPSTLSSIVGAEHKTTASGVRALLALFLLHRCAQRLCTTTAGIVFTRLLPARDVAAGLALQKVEAA